MIKSRFLIITFIFLLFSCRETVKKDDVKAESAVAQTDKRYFVFLQNSGFRIIDDNYNLLKSVKVDDSIKSYDITDQTLFLLGNNIYSYNLKDGTEKSKISLMNKPTKEIIISSRQGVFYISDKTLIFKERSKEKGLLSCDTPIDGIWSNPYHNYIYAHDSLGYLYAIDFESKMLKRRFYAGRISSMEFSKYGTRILVVTDKSFLVLDFETLNIIFEIKDFFARVATFDKFESFFLFSSIDKKVDVYNSITYKKTGSFKTSTNDIVLKGAQDSFMMIFSTKAKGAFLFNKQTRFGKWSLKNYVDPLFLGFFGKVLYFGSDSLIYALNIEKDSVMQILNSDGTFASEMFFLKSAFATVQSEEDTVKHEKTGKIFSIQLYALTNKEYAENMVNQVKLKTGLEDIFIVDDVINEKIIYRLFVGKFTDHQRADMQREILIKSGYGRDILVKEIDIK